MGLTLNSLETLPASSSQRVLLIMMVVKMSEVLILAKSERLDDESTLLVGENGVLVVPTVHVTSCKCCRLGGVPAPDGTARRGREIWRPSGHPGRNVDFPYGKEGRSPFERAEAW